MLRILVTYRLQVGDLLGLQVLQQEVYILEDPPSPTIDSVNTIVYVTIQTLGDALDFGDLTNVNTYTGLGGIVSSQQEVFVEV